MTRQPNAYRVVEGTTDNHCVVSIYSEELDYGGELPRVIEVWAHVPSEQKGGYVYDTTNLPSTSGAQVMDERGPQGTTLYWPGNEPLADLMRRQLRLRLRHCRRAAHRSHTASASPAALPAGESTRQMKLRHLVYERVEDDPPELVAAFRSWIDAAMFAEREARESTRRVRLTIVECLYKTAIYKGAAQKGEFEELHKGTGRIYTKLAPEPGMCAEADCDRPSTKIDRHLTARGPADIELCDHHAQQARWGRSELMPPSYKWQKEVVIDE